MNQRIVIAAVHRERKDIIEWLQSKIDSYAAPSNAMEQSERWAYICARDYIIGRNEGKQP